MSNKKARERVIRRREAGRIWPLALAGGGLVLVALAAIALWRDRATPAAQPLTTGAPQLGVDRDRVDLGDVPLGQTVQVSFELTNTGDRPLRFTADPYVEVVEGC
jgi:hypothetical protein